MSMVRNERTKLTATFLSNVGTAFIATGIIVPAATAIYGGAARSGFSPIWIAVFIGWLFGGTGLHVLGRTVIGRMDDNASNLPDDRAAGDGGLPGRGRAVVDAPPVAPE